MYSSLVASLPRRFYNVFSVYARKPPTQADVWSVCNSASHVKFSGFRPNMLPGPYVSHVADGSSGRRGTNRILLLFCSKDLNGVNNHRSCASSFQLLCPKESAPKLGSVRPSASPRHRGSGLQNSDNHTMQPAWSS